MLIAKLEIIWEQELALDFGKILDEYTSEGDVVV